MSRIRFMSAKRRSAFTLVELLVVIGIIALLMSILLPALNKARENARQVKCSNNMRQIWFACLMYANDYKDTLPIPPRVENTFLQGFSQAILMKSMGVYNYDLGTLWPYISKSAYAREQVFNCPTDLDSFRTVMRGTVDTTASYERNFTYSWNAQLRGSEKNDGFWNSTGIKLASIVMPGQKIVQIEETTPNDGCAFIATVDGDDTISNRHLKRGNCGFADGHVEAIFPEDLGFNTNHPTDSTYINAQKRALNCDLFYRP